MSEQEKTALLSAWVEGDLSDTQRAEFEALCVADEGFAARVEQANLLHATTQRYAELTPPSWDKQATFELHAVNRSKWWQWSGLPATAMACSLLAVAVSVTDFSIQFDNGRLQAGFAMDASAPISAESVDQIVQAKLADYQQTNQALFQQYVDALQTQQQQNGAQLTEYLLSSSRQERREDFAELIKFINEQRSDDQLFYARQLNNLQQEIYTQTGIPVNQPTPSSTGSVLPNEE